ncbi:hypothetical protein EJ05DRAFT_485315 [Pseudovirgaria hyperparasitica]|uniref:DNA damage-responsive protein 48 n=1 Tax=Pseudovirgaria hyperparasitica TaxID=470096 RepID=A0A6A6WCI1_9PEZI|nr:uncharacterized protein EJ05DRAFT_485315 [Pseudovirgaria hyperparasitica]KAF2759277.1 hypothetical protein EJ05DRAFT_485315 [Pseudovirgaria hyperparasitica]
MDFVKNFTGGDNNNNNNNNNNQNNQQNNEQFNQQQGGQQKEEGGFLSGITNKLNSAAGGGKESEKNEDYLDKGVDYVQEKFLGKGPQDNESAAEQFTDEQISDQIRKQYKAATGSDFPIPDKET